MRFLSILAFLLVLSPISALAFSVKDDPIITCAQTKIPFFPPRTAVHELITLRAYKEVFPQYAIKSYKDTSIWEYIRGVLWVTDPEGLLFKDDVYDQTCQDGHYAQGNERCVDNGPDWECSFVAARDYYSNACKALSRPTPGSIRWLMPQTLCGDLSFLHARSGSPRDQLEDVQRRMLIWADFVFQVATGAIAVELALNKVSGKVKGFDEFQSLKTLPVKGTTNPVTVRHLFTTRHDNNLLPAEQVKQRALGSLLHMLQDSFVYGTRLDPPGYQIINFAGFADPRKTEWEVIQTARERGVDSMVESIRGGRDAYLATKKIFSEIEQKPISHERLLETFRAMIPLSEKAFRAPEKTPLPPPPVGVRQNPPPLKDDGSKAALKKLRDGIGVIVGGRPSPVPNDVEDQLKADPAISVEERKGNLYIILPDKLLFPQGDYELSGSSHRTLLNIANVLKDKKAGQASVVEMLENSNRKLLINGHTDPDAPASNWKLSSLRAIEVAKYLIQSGGISPKLVVPSGYAHYERRGKDNTKKEKEKDRRVEIVIQPDIEKLKSQLKHYADLLDQLAAQFQSQ